MHHGAAVGDDGGLEDLLLQVDRQGVVLDHQPQEGDQVAGVEGAGVRGDAAGHVAPADDLHPIGRGHDLVRPGALDIAACLDRQIDDDRAGLHRGDVRRRHQLRGGAAGDQGRGDDHVLLDDVGGGQVGLLGLIFGRHGLGVAPRRLGRLELLVLDGDEFGAQALDLLLGGGAYVGSRDDRPQTPRGGDGLKPRDARAHDEDLGGGHRPGGRHHHGEALAIGVGRLDHRPISGQVGLGRQGVHHLGAGDARHEFHGEGGGVRAPQRLDRGLVAPGVQQADDDRAGLQGADFRRRRAAHLQKDVRTGQRRRQVRLHAGPRVGVVGVRQGGA